MEEAKLSHKVVDFINVFKGFIGSNFLLMPFAFAQSGIVFGTVMLVVVAILTDHTCQKIVRCKSIIIKRLITELERNHNYELLPDKVAGLYKSGSLIEQLERKMTLGHVAKYTHGKKGQWLVSISIFMLQFGFCTSYTIFIGNTLQEFFSPKHSNPENATIAKVGSIEATSQVSLIYFIMAPVPIFILLSLLRTVRKIGWISTIAIIIFAFSYLSILGYILSRFELSTDYYFIKYREIPVVLGLIIASFEGIGTIIPVESSMVGNRSNFPKYLHISIGLVVLILWSFGIVGYLQYGDKTEQIFPQNLPQSILIFIINTSLICITICTYPLQMFPVTEIVEFMIFRMKSSNKVSDQFANDNGRNSADNCVDTNYRILEEGNSNGRIATNIDYFGCDGEALRLTPNIGDRVLGKKERRMINIIEGTTTKAPAWKRNIVRVVLVLLQMGLAIAMRNNYAYLSSFIGAIGGSFLLFILPAAVHYKLGSENGDLWCYGCWDICIVIFGVVGSIISLVVTFISIIHS